MGDLLKSFTAGFSRFALTWLLPSGSFFLAVWFLLIPQWGGFAVLIGSYQRLGVVESALLLVVISLTISLVFSLASLPMYRFLEGYSLPSFLSQAWTRRQIVRKRRLSAMAARLVSVPSLGNKRAIYLEQLAQYPLSESLILPTRLGNAYKALESYGHDNFGLDSQSLWYELQAVSTDRLRQDSDDARASVDFFVSLTIYLAIFSALAMGTFVLSYETSVLGAGVAALILGRWSYLSAVRNTTDWRWSVQALIHVNRVALANALGYRVPATLNDERRLWGAWSAMANRGGRRLTDLDSLRLPPPS